MVVVGESPITHPPLHPVMMVRGISKKGQAAAKSEVEKAGLEVLPGTKGRATDLED